MKSDILKGSLGMAVVRGIRGNILRAKHAKHPHISHLSRSFPKNLLKRRAGDIYLALFFVALLASGCRSANDTPVNLQQSLVSPSGRYTLTLLIEENMVNPAYSETKVWKVTVSEGEQTVYKDEASEFVGRLMVYWLWDTEDRVWLYNSDTGEVYFWEQVDAEWIKTKWGTGKTPIIEREIMPPPDLYPPYVE